MKQSHNETEGNIANHLSTGLKQVTAPVLAIHTYRQHTMNGTIQKKKYSRPDFQGLLFVFECMVVIISSYILKSKIPAPQRDLHYGTTNTGNSESYLCSSIVYTLQFNT